MHRAQKQARLPTFSQTIVRSWSQQAFSGHGVCTEQCCRWRDGHEFSSQSTCCKEWLRRLRERGRPLAPGLRQLLHFLCSLALEAEAGRSQQAGLWGP